MPCIEPRFLDEDKKGSIVVTYINGMVSQIEDYKIYSDELDTKWTLSRDRKGKIKSVIMISYFDESQDEFEYVVDRYDKENRPVDIRIKAKIGKRIIDGVQRLNNKTINLKANLQYDSKSNLAGYKVCNENGNYLHQYRFEYDMNGKMNKYYSYSHIKNQWKAVNINEFVFYFFTSLHTGMGYWDAVMEQLQEEVWGIKSKE